MYICVECGGSIPYLFKELFKGNIRLAVCPHCHQIADKYIEWEVQMVLVDLILNRPQAYRHILSNRFRSERKNRAVWKFLVVIFALNAFDRWYLNVSGNRLPLPDSVVTSPTDTFTRWLLPHDHEWILLLTSIGETLIHIGTMYAGTRMYLHRQWGKYNFHANSLLLAIVLSCFSKLGVLLWMVWDADYHHRLGIELLTTLSNLVAITVFIGSQPDERANFPATVIVGLAILARKWFGSYMSAIEPAIKFSWI